MASATWFDGLHHVGFSVADLERSVAFWERLLGVEARFRGRLDRPCLAERVGYPGRGDRSRADRPSATPTRRGAPG